MDVKAYFWKDYRNETKLIFKGNENKCIGIILMLNPGSCEPKNDEKPKEKREKPVVCNPDKTMDKIKETILVIYAKHDDKLNGYVFIVNLCDKKGNPKDLIKKDFEETDGKDKDVLKEIENKIKQVEWIWEELIWQRQKVCS